MNQGIDFANFEIKASIKSIRYFSFVFIDFRFIKWKINHIKSFHYQQFKYVFLTKIIVHIFFNERKVYKSQLSYL